MALLYIIIWKIKSNMQRHRKTQNIILLIIFSTLMLQLPAQNSANCFRIQLKDKAQSPYSVNRPEEFLSPRAINNKARYNIPITVEDLPVNPQYKQLICAVDNSIRILSESKWQNTVVIYCPNSSALEMVKSLSFTDTTVIPVASYNFGARQKKDKKVLENHNLLLQSEMSFDSLYDYGPGWDQIAFHNGHRLHELGFYGDGMLIAVLDGGWEGFDTLSIFRPLYENGQIIGTRDLIPDHNNVYDGGSHGTSVTSTMAAGVNGQLIGSAPHASYFFILSENPYSEQLIEEDFWAQGVEIADSLGADVINSSLGYSTFDEFPQGNFTYASCDGLTSIASRNASLACQKGIVVCTSAGNEGGRVWHYITHPADAVDILSVGAASASDSSMAYFSSYGPSADGRVKPEVVSVGWDTYVVNAYGDIHPGSGTSFASPVLAGLTACLRQALPQKNALEIIDIVCRHGHQYATPDTIMGYGIPDMYQAYLDHANESVANRTFDSPLTIYPNPGGDQLMVANPDLSINLLEIYDVNGDLVSKFADCAKKEIVLPVHSLQPGLYVICAKGKNKVRTAKFIKQ